jgi:hypothetical protein
VGKRRILGEEGTRPSIGSSTSQRLPACVVSAESRAFYDRKGAEGKRYTQALIALAHQRVNVVWEMLGDGTTFEERSAA